MTEVLKVAGLSFLRAFGAAALTYAIGILAAPNLDQAYVLGAAAVIGSVVAGFRAIQEFIPQLSFVSYISQPYAGYVDSFARAFIGSLVTSIIGVSVVPELSTVKALVTSAVIAAIAAGLKAIQSLAPTPGPTG